MSEEKKAIDYTFTEAEIYFLKGAVLLPYDIRCELLAKHKKADLIKLFAQFIGLANSVVENNREMIEFYLVTEKGEHPQTAEKINLPTIFGAMCGVKLSEKIDQSKTCEGCAFRSGTCANQSPSTTVDAEWCGDPYEKQVFMCHMHLDDNGEPTRKCTGYTQFRKLQK